MGLACIAARSGDTLLRMVRRGAPGSAAVKDKTPLAMLGEVKTTRPFASVVSSSVWSSMYSMYANAPAIGVVGDSSWTTLNVSVVAAASGPASAGGLTDAGEQPVDM